MKLAAFLESESKKKGGLTLRGLARKAKVNESTVWRAAKGKNISLGSAIKISRATRLKDGQFPLVKIEDLLQIEMEI